MKQLRYRFKLLALLLFAMFAALMLYGAYNIVNYGTRWFSSSHNPRVAAQKENVIAGNILDRSGVLLASTDEAGSRIYHEDPSVRSALVHVIGDPDDSIANGVESFMTEYLYGFRSSLPDMIKNLLSGGERRGDNVVLTLDSALCAQIPTYFNAYPATRGKSGAAAVMNWKTGELLALVSLPSFDPMNTGTEQIDHLNQPFLNRTTRGRYPPGDLFKVIAASAAIGNVPDAEAETFYCSGALIIDTDHTIRDSTGEEHGLIGLRKAFMKNCDPFFADLASRRLGDALLRREAENYGFNDNVLFRDLVVENSIFTAGSGSAYDIAVSSLGQNTVMVTPIHMCLVAACIANNGIMMEPRLIHEVSSPAGTSVLSFSSAVYRKACRPEQAAALQQYMADFFLTDDPGRPKGTAGGSICGKAGTAKSFSGENAVTYGWFIGYAADENLPYALCVLTEDIADGETGADTSARIANDIFIYLENMAAQRP